MFEDDFAIPMLGYVSFLEGIAFKNLMISNITYRNLNGLDTF